MARAFTDLWTRKIATEYGLGAPRVAFADGDDDRVRAACPGLLDAGVTPVLLGTERGRIPRDVEYVHIDGPRPDSVRKVLGDVAERRYWDEPQLNRCLQDPQYVAAAMVRSGAVDAAVAGAQAPSGAVIRAALQVIGLRESASLLSSSFMMELPGGRQLAFGDCAVVPDPDAGQLAEIAADVATTYSTLSDERPAVAMLSFSTYGSASHPDVETVREATAIVRQQHPDLDVDGELQFDAAFVDSVGQRKCPGSPVAGHANIFIFPNLAAGNIGYKIAQRLAGAQAYGPVLQGLLSPMNDLSRGCTADDVLSVGLISALTAA